MTVKLLIGHICAGKTTYARDEIKDKNIIRLSMDDLKIMMFGKLSSDKKTEDIIAACINNTLLLLDGLDSSDDVLIDGFPLDLESLNYITSQFTTEIMIFTVGLFKANLRNRKRDKEDGIFIEPEEIKRYNDNFDKFKKSNEFAKATKGVVVTYIHNYEKNKKCLVM